MKTLNVLVTAVFTFDIWLCIFVASEKTLTINKCTLCDDGSDYPSKIYVTFNTKNNVQYMTGNLTLNEDFGNNVMIHIRVFMITPPNNKSVQIFVIKETYCKLCRTYIGPFMDDLEKAAQILPGACPIPKGKYHLTDFPVNVNRIFLKAALPHGTFKFIGTCTDTKTQQILMCFEIDVQVS